MIENIWSHLKKDYRKRAGINKGRIALFIKEFMWKKKNLKRKQTEDFLNGFIKLIRFFKIND
ncbi:hypothetical protein H312_03028 [Anncaliia algerae PRA339]|uniref:ISXO2-like transposase domain-containing protein n=1 Tax=Anncaliia algerae PRA339 TaxID=1288291 RepID=A0A059EX53_9MICR|nr:hypothetical protein H312_03028 [Anncaliia algerae PRA339]